MAEFLTGFQVDNFKKFNTLKVENIGAINLITGDNNVGKTSLLEALLVTDDYNKTITFIHRILCQKNIHIHPSKIESKTPNFPRDSYFKYLKNNPAKSLSFKLETKNASFILDLQDCLLDDLIESDFVKRKKDNYNVGNPQNWIKISVNNNFEELQWMYKDDFERKLVHDFWPLISFDAGYQDDINHFYKDGVGVDENSTRFYIEDGELVEKFKTLEFLQKKKFIESLSMFIKDVEDTAIKSYYGRDILSIKLKTFDDYKPITFWGEGFNKFVRYLLEIIKCKENRILIDEIDTGIHWTKQLVFWKNIMQSCIHNNVQLFATTHSLDSVKSFITAAEELEINEKVRLIELKEVESNLYANTFSTTEVSSALDSDLNIRGGNIYG